MRRKNQKIPDSIWQKLERIRQLKENAWNMMTIVNECINTGANWWIKKLEKEAGTKSPGKPTSNENDTPIPTDEEVDKAIEEIENGLQRKL